MMLMVLKFEKNKMESDAIVVAIND